MRHIMRGFNRYVRGAGKWSAIAFAGAAAAYGTYVGVTWYRYGNVGPPAAEDEDPLLDLLRNHESFSEEMFLEALKSQRSPDVVES